MAAIDLHIHSQYSCDGEFAVADLVAMCSARGLKAFSITDHNSVKGASEACALASQTELRFLPGIEIDCNFKGVDMHLLGYGIAWQSADFSTLEQAVSAKVMDSFGAMVDNLCRLGFAVDADAVLAAAAGGLPTGELIAEVMLCDSKYHTPLLLPYLPGGARSDMPYINFYLDYFAQGRPAYVQVEYMPFTQAVELICDNGGVPIVAHPGLNFRGRERAAEELLDRGAAGLEVFNNYHDASQVDYLATLTVQRNAWMTCGSDFHGKTKPRIAIGQFASVKGFESRLMDFIHHVNRIRRQGV